MLRTTCTGLLLVATLQMVARYLQIFFIVIFITHTVLKTQSHLCPKRWSAPLPEDADLITCIHATISKCGIFCVLVVGTCWESLVSCLVWKLKPFGWFVFEYWLCVCTPACVPKGSWLRWGRRWVGCDSPSLPILLLLSDRLWCHIWLVIDSGSCAVVCQQRPMIFFFSPSTTSYIWKLQNSMIYTTFSLC